MKETKSGRRSMLMRALKDSFTKLDPREQVKNPVMFLVYLSALLTTVLFALSLGGISDGIVTSGFILAIAVILWLTCLFSNFAEALQRAGAKPRRIPCGPQKRMYPPTNWRMSTTTAPSLTSLAPPSNEGICSW